MIPTPPPTPDTAAPKWQGPYDQRDWQPGDRVRDQFDGTHLGTVEGPAGHRNHFLVRWDDPMWGGTEEYAGDISPESDPWRAK